MHNEESLLLAETENPDYEAIAKIKSAIIQCEAANKELEIKAQDNFVTEDDIAKVISLSTGIPVRKIIDSDMSKLACMEEHLKARIIGQAICTKTTPVLA